MCVFLGDEVALREDGLLLTLLPVDSQFHSSVSMKAACFSNISLQITAEWQWDWRKWK